MLTSAGIPLLLSILVQGGAPLVKTDSVGRQWTTQIYPHRLAEIRSSDTFGCLAVQDDADYSGSISSGDDVWHTAANSISSSCNMLWVFNYYLDGMPDGMPTYWPKFEAMRLTAVDATLQYNPSGSPPDWPITNYSTAHPDDADVTPLCLNVEWASQSNGAVLQVHSTCQSSASTIEVKTPGLDLAGLYANFSSTNYSNTLLFLTPGQSDGVRLKFLHSGKCINIPWGCSNPSSPGCLPQQMQQYTCQTSPSLNESWIFHYPQCNLQHNSVVWIG